ncbi:hypothetical protein BV898_03755 [Hypsibius exemplaris]|uniref:E3 ubiquitin-protein ligase RBBP6 n=1 Tax=Hypsibius exemplaris TaxID=2072580 RepID=A0A1W0X4P3_HYPEX|nr:hypothetical protein BV898_03755 [Hypsibius exemplaris]
MVMADAVIHFRFKNEKDSDVKKFPFAGAATTVRELKDYITQKHRLDNPSTRPDKRQAPSELSIENLETGLVYISDETDIPNGTTVIVSRKLAGGEGSSSDVAAQAAAAAVEQQQPASDSSPASSQSQLAKPPVPRKVIKRTGSDLNEAYFYKDSDAAVNGGLATGGLSDPKWVELGFVGKIKQDTNLSECTWLLEKNQSYALQYQCLLYYDHTVYVHRASRASSTAYCTKCQVKGHWANACTAAMDYNSPVGGGMHRRNGGVRAPTVLASTVTTNPQAYASVPVDSGEYEDIPPELRCGICQGLIRDAVTMPCCDKSFCDSCVQNLLISDTGSVCPNCKAEVQLDSCTANSLLRDSVAKWEREMQVKRQKRKDDVLSAGRSASDGIKKEPTTSPANAAHPLNHGGTRPNFYNRNQAMSTSRSEGGNQQFVRGQQQNDGPRSANEPMRIGSVLGRSNPSSVTASMFQQPPQQQQQQQRIPSSGGFPLASTNFMGNTVQQRLRGDIRPPANPMPFFPPPFSDFSGFMGAAGFPMDPSSFTAMRRLPSHAAYMARMGYGAFMGVPGGAQSVAMQQQLQRSLAAQAQQQQQQQSGGGVSSLPNLRITRTPNQQPKVPVQSPFDSSSSSQDRRSSPDKPSSRSDDYRDKDRRDKEDDRRRGGDDRSKYDDRDRRSGEKRRSSHDDRRSPDQRSRRDVSPRDRGSKRPRVDSPDRRSDVKKESSGGSSSLSSRMDGGSKQAMEKERERSRKEITPPSKVASSSRAMEKEKEVLRDVKSEKPDHRSVRLRELEPLRPEEKETRPKLQQPDESREVRIKQEEKETSTRPKASEEKVAVESPAPPSAKVKIEAPSSTPPPSSTAARPTIRKDTGSFFKDAAGRTERAAPTKTTEQPVSAAAPKKDSPPPAVRVLIRAPSPGPVTVPVKTSTSTTEEQGNASDHSDTAVKERSGESKKERSSKKDKSSRSSRKDKDRKPSKSSREKRARSASSEKRSTKRRSDKKRSAPEDDGVFLGHIQHPDGVEVDDGTAGEHRDEQQPPVRSEKRSHKSSRSSRKDKESKSSRNRSPSRESRKRESRRNSENDEMSSERSKKSSHKSSKSSRNKEKYSKSSNEKTADGDAVDSASSSLRKDKTVQDARVMLDEKRRQDSSAGRLNGGGRGSDRDSQEYERISSRKSDQAGSGDADEDAGGGGKSSKSTRHKSKSKKDKSSKSSRGEKHSSRSSPSGEKRHKKKKHRRDKRETGDGGRSPAGDDDDRQE